MSIDSIITCLKNYQVEVEELAHCQEIYTQDAGYFCAVEAEFVGESKAEIEKAINEHIDERIELVLNRNKHP